MFRSTLGGKLAFYGDKNFTPVFFLAATSQNLVNRVDAALNRRVDWNLENTVSYSKDVQDHSFTILLGQGAYRENDVTTLDVTKANIPVTSYDQSSLRFKVPADDITASGTEGESHTISSLFARLNYNFKETYLLTGVIRRDGPSRFSEKYKYGVFPSGSVGWVTSLENFWPQNEILNFLKIRGGYGVVGSDNFDNYVYLARVGGGRNYTIGNSDASGVGYS